MRGRSTGIVSREENSHFYAPTALFPRQAPPFPLDISLPVGQSRAVCSGDEKKTVPLPGISLRYLGRLTNTAVGIEMIYSGCVELLMGLRKLWDTLKILGEEAFGLRAGCSD
jgi:hypothetical protein